LNRQSIGDTSLEDMSLEEFINLPGVIDLIVRYNANLRDYIRDRSYIRIGNIVHSEQAIVYVIGDKLDGILRDLGANQISLYSIVMGLMGRPNLEAAGIIQVQEQPYLDLRGSGVLIGFLDTGIDYTKDAFKYEDGTSKIQYIWDQTEKGNLPEGYYYGAEYTNKEINEALKQEDPYNMVPHKDNVGHGTFLASVAASRENNQYIGAAPDSELIVVKLRKAREYYINRFLVPPGQENVFQSTDAILAIEYMINKAAELNRPLAICIGMGSNESGHDGFNSFEEYIATISNITGISVCTAAGNESHARHHTYDILSENEDMKSIEVKVPENSYSFKINIWNNPSDRMSVSIISPTGEKIERVPAKSGTTVEVDLSVEKTTVKIEYYFPVKSSGSQLTIVYIINPIPGIWTINVHGDIVLDGTYHAWLPITSLVSPGIEFINPVPNYTIVVPSTTIGGVTCGAYNNRDNSLYINSSWGPTRSPVIRPDLVAPGVDVIGIYPSGPGTMTGTSASTSITTGASALMLQWGIVQENDITLNTYKVRAYLIRGADRENSIDYPSVQWGYGRLNLFNAFNQIRPIQ